jgi:spore germination protein YaaH
LIQIGRCYGASFDDIRNANPQIADPDFILPSMIVTVPRIGSTGRIYGPPCITFYTAQSGDTWTSIAQRFNADLIVLQRVNPATFSAGTVLKIPLNSAGAVGVTPITSTPTPTGTTTPLQRITIDPGQTTASRIGIVNPNETIHYVLGATPGQVLSITLTATVNEVAIGVKGPTGLTLKQLDATQTWSTTIVDGGDYFIDIASILGSSSKSYTLNVSLVSPTETPTPTETATPTPTTPAP